MAFHDLTITLLTMIDFVMTYCLYDSVIGPGGGVLWALRSFMCPIPKFHMSFPIRTRSCKFQNQEDLHEPSEITSRELNVDSQNSTPVPRSKWTIPHIDQCSSWFRCMVRRDLRGLHPALASSDHASSKRKRTQRSPPIITILFEIHVLNNISRNWKWNKNHN